MGKYDTVIFDLDGTLIDTSPGILNCYQHTAQKMGMDCCDPGRMRKAIGSPLLSVFMQYFEMEQEKAVEAVGIYRKEYQESGIYQAKVYSGIHDLLIWLKERDFRIGVATLKLDSLAKEVLAHFGLLKYLDAVCGIDMDDRLTKAQLITACIGKLHSANEASVFIGDSEFDGLGAAEAGVDFIGVTYGFGFSGGENLNHPNVYFSDDPQDLIDFLKTTTESMHDIIG